MAPNSYPAPSPSQALAKSYGATERKHLNIPIPVSSYFFTAPKLLIRTRVQAIYNPEDWKETIFAVFSHTYLSPAFFFTSFVGTVLVLLSASPLFILSSDQRSCRAWCSSLSLGSQAHQYVGIVLFLVMAFRNSAATAALNNGVKVFFAFKAAIRDFVNIIFNRLSPDIVTHEVRARAVALAVAFPYSVVLDIRDGTEFVHGTVEDMLSSTDIELITKAPTPPLAVLELLTAHINVEIKSKAPAEGNALIATLNTMVSSYGECERIKDFPMILSYVAHLRFLLCAYLITLPLALVESMGYSTVIVHWVVSYALMSIESLAVDCENPFDGQGKSDLRLLEQCSIIKEQALESWQRWRETKGKPCAEWREPPYLSHLVKT